MTSQPLSVVISSRNRGSQLGRCLESFPARDLAALSGQLVLVDNGSTDDTSAIMQAYRRTAPCRVDVVVEPNRGLARARNAGLKVADGDVIVFTDDDCYLGPGYLFVARRVFDSGEFHFCGGRILLHNPDDDRYGCNVVDEFKLVSPHRPLDTGVFQGSNLVVHRRVIDRVGGFDPSFGAGAAFRAEDIDFCAAAVAAGFAGAHVPELIVYHDHGRKRGQNIDDLKHANDFGRGAYYAKWTLRGHPGYLGLWLRHALSLFKVKRTLREIKGALRYWRDSESFKPPVDEPCCAQNSPPVRQRQRVPRPAASRSSGPGP